jgi:CubicO group peptidase (beta-lactamase class C family)
VAIARVQGGKVLWSLGCGYADMGTEDSIAGETVFNIGSISKSIAAWGCMKLVEEGKFDLDKPVEGYPKMGSSS